MSPRKRYAQGHWSRDADPASALEKYLRLYDDPFNQVKLALFLRLLPGNLSGLKVLDVGGGAGMMAVQCAKLGAEVTLLDAEANALNTARHFAGREGVAHRITCHCSDTIPADILARRYDIVIAKDIVEHIADDLGFIRQLAACQNRGGRLLLSTQNSFSLNYLLEGNYQRRWAGNRDWCGWDTTHLRFYNPRSLKRLLASAGYAINTWNSVYTIPYDILSWATLLRREIVLPSLRWVDLWLGGLFPFNRLGWDLVISASLDAPPPGAGASASRPR